MIQLNRAVICDERTPRVKVKVWAEVRDGCLNVEGFDMGKAVEEFFGAEDYEYTYSFDAPNTTRIFVLLSLGGADPVTEFLMRFKGIDGCEFLREFCVENKIDYKFYVHY